MVNKAGYMATQVVRRWAGAIFEVTRAFGQKQYGQRIKDMKKVKYDRRMDRQMDGRTDGWTDGSGVYSCIASD